LTPHDGKPLDYVSVIVPTYNSEKSLPLCLESIKKQNYLYTELLVVDNYSKDETRNVAAAFGAHVILHRGTQAAARNVGITNSKGSYVLFVDSDQKLDDGVIEDCVSLCSTREVEAVKIPEVFVGLNFWGKCSALWKNNLVKAWGLKGGIPRFYRKKMLIEHLAFYCELRWWEDMELYGRLKSAGLSEAWCNRKIIHNETDSPTLAVRKYTSYGKSITAFRGTEAAAPYTATVNLSFSTLAQMPRNSGRSMSVLLGCLFLVTIKTFSAALGFLSGLR
jgi:glycosyltransferase involved in cell wall biosynthesis